MPIETGFYNTLQAPKIESPLNALAQISQVQGAIGQNKLTEMKMAEHQRGLNEQDEYRSILTGSNGNLKDAKTALYGKGLFKQAMELEKADLDQQKARGDIAKTVSDVQKNKVELFRGMLGEIATPQDAATWLQAQYKDPDMAPIMSARGTFEQAVTRIPQDPKAFEQWRMQAGLGMEKFVKQTTPDANAQLQATTSRANNADTIAAASERRQDKPLPPQVLKQVQETRDNAATITNLASGFKDDFASKGILGFGADASMTAKGVLGNDKAAVEWWKNYKKQSELTERHALFGASLTPGEQASWRSADISPGMDAEVIKTNLETRRKLAEKVADYTRQDMIDAGHDEGRINKIAGRKSDAPAGDKVKKIDIGGKQMDAQLAADGKYYVKQANGKWARVD